MRSIDNFLNLFFQRIKASVTVQTEALACFRIFFGLSMLLFILPSWAWLSKVPPGFFFPRFFSFAYLTQGHLPHGTYLFFDVLVIILFLLIVLGIFTRFAFGSLFLICSILYSFSYTFDKIDHSNTILLFSYLCLSFTNIGAELAIKKDRAFDERTQQRALAVLALIICFGMFTAGFPKLINWVDFDLSTSGFLNWFYPGYFNVENNMLLTPLVFDTPMLVLEFMDYLAAIFEVTGIYFLWKGRKYWIGYLLVATFFHLANLFVLNIDFTQNIVCYAIYIVPPVAYYLYRKHKAMFFKYSNISITFVIGIAIIRVLMALTDFQFSFSKSFMFTSIISILISIFVLGSGIWFLTKKKLNLKQN